MKNILLALCLVLFPSFSASAQETAQPQHVKISLLPEHNKVQGGEGLWVLIQQSIDPGWHTYWINPGDSGAALRVKWTLPPGFAADKDMLWPTPHKVSTEGLVSYAYEGDVTLGQSIYIPEKIPAGPLELKAEIDVLVCKDICIPEKSTYTLRLNDPVAAAEDHGDTVDAFFNLLPAKDGWAGTYAEAGADFVADIDTGASPNLQDADIASFNFYPAEWGLVKNPATVRAEITPKGHLILRQAHDDRNLGEVRDVQAIVSFRNRSGMTFNQQVLLHPAAPGKAVPAGASPADVKKNSEAPQNTASNVTETVTLGGALLAALLGGLILNLMPCVFPVLSLKALSLVRLREKGWLKAASSGIVYTAGVLSCFALIGGVLLSVRVAGGDAGWGFQLQNPVIVLFLAYLLLIVGLNLVGLFELHGAFANFGERFTRGNGVLATFMTGVLATLVATPCTAPFMATALGYALVQPPDVAMTVFLALGLGLALPYLVLSLVPPLTALLPRPGAWMQKLREILAFPMFISAGWLIWVLGMQASSAGFLWSICGTVSIAFSIWLLRHQPRNRLGHIIVVLLAAGSLLFAAVPLLDRDLLLKKAQGIAEKTTVQAYSAETLKTMLDGNDPVFVYMTASWCITCKVNEAMAIDKKETQDLFRAMNVHVMEGDWTSMNPAITEFLKSYERSGVPLYVYYGARVNGQRPDPVVLPQILTPGTLANYIHR